MIVTTWRAIVGLALAFHVGQIVSVLIQYARSGRTMLHVPWISAAYLSALAVIALDNGWRIFALAKLTWRLPLYTVTVLGGIVAIELLKRDLRQRRIDDSGPKLPK